MLKILKELCLEMAVFQFTLISVRINRYLFIKSQSNLNIIPVDA